jgi:hypothetical protein
VDGRSFTTPDCEGSSGTVCMPRLKSSQASYLTSKEENTLVIGITFVDTKKNCVVINQVLHRHHPVSKDCILTNVTVIEQHKPLWLPVNSRYISPMEFLKSSNITKLNIYATITAQNWFMSWTGKIKVIRTKEN